MANRRMLSGDTWRSEFIGGLNFFERILWTGLITACADDQGRILNNPILIRADVFPFDDVSIAQIERALGVFVSAGKLHQYEVDGKKLLQIVNWWKYQTPSWASPSKYPAPDGWVDREKYHTVGNKIDSKNWGERGGFHPLCSDLPSDQHRPLNDVKSDVKSDVEQKDSAPAAHSETTSTTTTATAHFYTDDATAEGIYVRVTGTLGIPVSQKEIAIDAIRSVRAQKTDDNETVIYLKKYWREWRERKYSPANVGWLDWALAGEAPTPRANGTGAPKTRTLTSPDGRTIEVRE